jgi:hypothetical protein
MIKASPVSHSNLTLLIFLILFASVGAFAQTSLLPTPNLFNRCNQIKPVQIKVEYGQLPEMATAFGVRLLGTALVLISRFYRLQGQVMQWAFFPSLPEYRGGLPKRLQAAALQRLRRSDFCPRFN